MQTANVRELRKRLTLCTEKELREICVRMAKFKKENKELLTYLLFESADEEGYIRAVEQDIEQQFSEITTKSYYYMKKSVRKILRQCKRYIRYSQKKATAVEILMCFCVQLRKLRPNIRRNRMLTNLYNRQIKAIHKNIEKVHEDLQYDYQEELKELELYEL